MSDANPNTPVTPKSALDTLKEWKELTAFVALTLASVLNGVFGGGHANLQKASWIVAVVLVAVGAYVIHRKQKRKREQERRERIWAESEAQRNAGSAFRSLAPFEERDTLPGKDRKVEARAIATRIASDDFRFGVVCGDTGCGKTSMLRSEVTRVLRESGFEVAYVRNPRRLEGKTSEALPPTQRLASELRALARNYIKPTTGAVILDQFEEWFIEYQEPEHRVQIGKFIRKLAERSQRARILCAIRREFLIDFHDLSDELPQQLSTTNLFHIKNFTVDQAKDVINECATADGLAPDESFAETVAHDLAEGGQVRPPELQIVCTYLAVSGGLNTPKYRQAGGTGGILAHYIQDALSSSKAPDVGARLLRALCDFSTRAKRKPRTLDELTSDVQTDDSISDSNLKNTVAGLVQHFVLGRIVAEEQRRDEATAFALMHDYLVDAVQLATSDASTKTEEANQLLRYYVGEQRGTIPLRKLRFIRTFADRAYLEEPNARQLMRRSTVAPLLWLGIIVIIAGALAAVGYLVVTTQIQWKEELIARHFPEGDSGPVIVEMLPNKRITTTDYQKYCRIWDGQTGQLLGTINNPPVINVTISPSGKYLVLGNDYYGRRGTSVGGTNRDQPARIINLSTMEEASLPIESGVFRFSMSEKWLSWVEENNERWATLVIYSVLTKQVVSRNIKVTLLEDSNIEFHQCSDSGDRSVLLERDGAETILSVYDSSAERRLAVLGHNLSYGSFTVHGASSLVCTLSSEVPGVSVIRLWDLRNGELVQERQVASLPTFSAIKFSVDGSRLILGARASHELLRINPGGPEVVSVLRVSDLEPDRNVLDGLSKLALRFGSLILWAEEKGTKIWGDSFKEPKLIQGLRIAENDRVLISDNQQRLGIWRRPLDSVELWDLTTGQLIAKLSHRSPLTSVEFTVADTGLALWEEGEVLSLFDAIDGERLLNSSNILMASSGTIGNNDRGVIVYDRFCRRFYVWNRSGQVLRYTEGRKYFGRFMPSRSCK